MRRLFILARTTGLKDFFLLLGSDRSVNSLSNDSPFSWDGDGFDADERFAKYTVRNPRGQVVADEL